MSSIPTFGELLALALEERGLTHRAFAAKCGISSGHPTNLISGKRTPQLDKINAMATVLRLSDEKKEEFWVAALLTHSPPEVAVLIADLRRKLAQAEQQSALIIQELRRAGIKLPKELRQ